jgi:hypothetical protein
MRITVFAVFFVVGLWVVGAQAQAQTPLPACVAMDKDLKDGLEAWRSKGDVGAVGGVGELSKAELRLGAAAKVTLLQTSKVDYPVRPEKPGGSVSHGGLLAFTVAEPGTYRVALSTPAWIEVVRDGKTIAPGSFGPGPECTSIRKIVEFPLTAGAHVLEIAANAENTVNVLVVRKK